MRVEEKHVVSNSTYDIFDWTREDFTLSSTFLHERSSTRGHAHGNQHEMYFFLNVPLGDVRIVIGDDVYPVRHRDVFWVEKGKFHRVINNSDYPCEFLAFFVGKSQRPDFK